MNRVQSKLFHKVLENMEEDFQERLDYYLENRRYDDAENSFIGLKHVGTILNDFEGRIYHDDMVWVVDEIFGEDWGSIERHQIKEGTEFIKSFNNNICTDSEVKGLIDELLNY